MPGRIAVFEVVLYQIETPVSLEATEEESLPRAAKERWDAESV